MNIFDYMLIAVIGVGFITAVIYLIRKKGSGGCAGCSGSCSDCKQYKANKKTKK